MTGQRAVARPGRGSHRALPFPELAGLMNAVHADMPRPRALLLDFGGVVAHTTTRPQWVRELARDVELLLEPQGVDGLSATDIEMDIRAAAEADTSWKAAMSRMRAPRELTATEFWAEFVAADWPDGLRDVVTAHAADLCYRMGIARSTRVVRRGIEDLLDAAQRHDVPVAIVSNALSGAVHRDFLAGHGLGARFAAQVYSDEVGVRKPNPELILTACRELHVAATDVWYVGDTPDRDVLCGHRARAAATILMLPPATDEVSNGNRQQPDEIVADPDELRELLNLACRIR